MERKNYLVEELSENEKAYLKETVINERRRYIRDNYKYLNSFDIDIYDVKDVECESVLESVINKCEDEIKSAVEFEKIVSDNRLFYAIKALSLKEKMVLFSLYKENKPINQIAIEMNIERTTIWRIKCKALDRIMEIFMGGKENV